jgi:hypothetical protein
MKKQFLLSLTVLSLVTFLLPNNAHAVATTACNTPIQTDSSGYADCYTSEGSQKYTMLQIGLCKSEPTYLNYEQKCDLIINDANGLSVELTSSGASTSLTGDSPVTIAEGTYTHAAILIDEKIALKGSYTFDKPLKGNSLNTGTTCWTTTGTWNEFIASTPGYNSISDLPFDCGSTPNPEYFTANYNAFSFYGLDVYAITNRTSPTGPYSMYVLDSNKSLPANGSGDLDGDYLFGIQEFNNPIVINANTSNVSLGFKLTDMFHIQSNYRNTAFNNAPADCTRNSSGGNACLLIVIPQGFEFTVTAQ